MSSHTDRVVVLVDMDCFYCQVEEKLNPALAGKPIAVVQYNAWRGGGIIAVNYPARDRGVTRHMRGNEAKEKCPEIELARVPNVRGKADLTKYREAGKRVAEVLQTFTPFLQRASVDEAYMDITAVVNERIANMKNKLSIEQLPNTHVVGCETKDFVCNVYEDMENESNLKLAVGGAVVEEIRASVYEKTGYRCSAGIAHNKILAKLVCGLHKPNQQTILPHDSVTELYKSLPLRKIKSLGGKFGVALSEDLNVTYMGELIQFTEKQLQKKYDEKTASWLYNIARGIDKEPVEIRLISKSIGCCKKFPGKSALKSIEDLTHWLSELATEISERLEQDREENNRRAKSMTVSFAQPVGRKDIHSSKVHPLNSYDAKKIAYDALEILKKMTQKPDGSFSVTFLGLNVGKFEDCKNINEISSFFKPAIKNQTNNNILTQNIVDKSTTNIKISTNNISSFFKTALKNIDKDVNSSNRTSFLEPNDKRTKICITPNKNEGNINKNTAMSINLNDIEEDAEQSPDIDLNQTFQDIQNLKCSKEDEGNYSDSTIEEDFSEEIKNRQEFPYISEKNKISEYPIENENLLKLQDTSNLVFNKRSENIDKSSSKSVCYIENTNVEITRISEISKNGTQIFDQPSCSYDRSHSATAIPILCNENSNSSSILDDMEKICPECNQKVHKYDYISHMDHHMAEKLMAEEKELFQIEFQAKKQSLNNTKMSAKTTNINKTKSAKRKSSSIENNSSITSFLTKEVDKQNIEMQQCPECDKRISLNDFACHLDFHAAKKLHLELNPVKYGGKTENININDTNNKKKNCKSTNGVISVSTFFKTV